MQLTNDNTVSHDEVYYRGKEPVQIIPSLSKIFQQSCFKTYDIFSEDQLPTVKLICRNLQRLFGNETTDMVVKLTHQTGQFSLTHALSETINIPSGYEPHLDQLNEIITPFVNRFAKELKWVGKHEFDFQIFRYTPQSHTEYKQKWHYDQGSINSMIMVVENDFEYVDGLGLNLAYNPLNGPYNPNTHTDELNLYAKDDQYASTNYPRNGAIVISSGEGRLIHCMTTLGKRVFDTPKSMVRTILQIKDRKWK